MPTTSSSFQITQILSSLNIQYTIQKRFKELGELRFDIYVDNNYIIEYDGEQHFLSNHRGSLEEIHNHDLVKNQFCFSHNIPIIRIPYTEQLTYTSKDLMLETTRFLLTPENESLYYKKLMEK